MVDAGDEPTDEALMAAWAGGDPEAFEGLFRRHRRPLFTYLLHRTASRALAEDLFQEVCLRLVRGRGGFAAGGSFRAWLYTIAHNALTDDRRRAALRAVPARDPGTGEDDPDPLDARRGTAPDPLERTHASDLGQRIEAALARLPEEQREVFLLRERAGLPLRAIAELAGVPLATVKSRMRYALAGLRRHLSAALPAFTESLNE